MLCIFYIFLPKVRDRKKEYKDDAKSGKPNSLVTRNVKQKLDNGGNSVHRTQLLLDGKRIRTGTYILAYLKDPNGFVAQGTWEQLQALGRDGSNFGEGKIHKATPFNDYKDDLVKKAHHCGTMVLKSYGPEAKDIPEGCLRNSGWGRGRLPKKDANRIFTYYFYHDDFKEGANTLQMPTFMEEFPSEEDSDAN